MTNSITFNYAAAVVTAAAMVLSLFAFAPFASAAINSSSITVTTTNRGDINNTTSAKSHTGQNTAFGSTGGDGAAGGDVTSAGSNNNGGATSGAGGNGGNGGAGGFVETGNASAQAGTENDLNTTDVGVDLTSAAVAGFNSSSVLVDTDNSKTEACGCNTIKNDTRARARSGDNTAFGSTGGDGDVGGAITGGMGDFNNGGANSGKGGSGGAGGLGGEIHTGNASSTAGTINLLNTSIVRVRI